MCAPALCASVAQARLNHGGVTVNPLFVRIDRQHSVPQIMHRVGATIALKGVRATDHFFTVPLNHRAAPPAGLPQDIEVFVREIAAPTKEVKPDPNYLLYLQGGVLWRRD